MKYRRKRLINLSTLANQYITVLNIIILNSDILFVQFHNLFILSNIDIFLFLFNKTI